MNNEKKFSIFLMLSILPFVGQYIQVEGLSYIDKLSMLSNNPYNYLKIIVNLTSFLLMLFPLPWAFFLMIFIFSNKNKQSLIKIFIIIVSSYLCFFRVGYLFIANFIVGIIPNRIDIRSIMCGCFIIVWVIFILAGLFILIRKDRSLPLKS